MLIRISTGRTRDLTARACQKECSQSNSSATEHRHSGGELWDYETSRIGAGTQVMLSDLCRGVCGFCVAPEVAPASWSLSLSISFERRTLRRDQRRVADG